MTYKVKFPIQNPVPKVTAIYYNNELLCTGPKDVGTYVTTITLDHTFTTGIPNALRPNPSPVRPQMIQTFQTTTRPPTTLPPQLEPSPNIQNQLYNVNFQCGVPEFRAPSTTGLVLGGYQAIRGQFPW